jgi:hypothetical protein
MEIENEQFIKNKQLVVIEKIKKDILKNLYTSLNILNENKDDIEDISMLLACMYTIKKYNLISDDELDNTLGKNYIYKVFKKKRDVLNELTKTQKVQIGGGLFSGLLFLGVLYLAVNTVESHLGISENALSRSSILSSHRNARDISLAENSNYASRFQRPQHTTNPSEEEYRNDKEINYVQFNYLYRLAIANTGGQCVFNSDLNAYPFETANQNFKTGAYSTMLLTNTANPYGQLNSRNTNFIYSAQLEKYRKNTDLSSDFVFTWDYVNEIIKPQLGKLFDEYVKLFPSFTGVVVFSAGIESSSTSTGIESTSAHQINLLVRRNNIGEVKYAIFDSNGLSGFLSDELNEELGYIAPYKDTGFLAAQPGFFLDKNNEKDYVITENPLEYNIKRLRNSNLDSFNLFVDDIQAFEPVTELPIVKLTGSNLDKILQTKGALESVAKTLDGYKKISQEEYEKQVGVFKERQSFKQFANAGIDNSKIMKEKTIKTYDVPEVFFSESEKVFHGGKFTKTKTKRNKKTKKTKRNKKNKKTKRNKKLKKLKNINNIIN